MDKRELNLLADYIDELVRAYLKAHEMGFHSRIGGEVKAQFKEEFTKHLESIAKEYDSQTTIEEVVGGRNVILFGGADKYEIPKVSNPVIIRTNNHYLWQEDPHKMPGGYPWTDGVYHGAGFGALLAMFMNVPPKKLKFVAQNCGHPYKSGLRPWCKRKGIAHFSYASRPGEIRETGLDPKKYEPIFKPLIEICEQPFTGVLAAFHLLTFPIKSLYLTGFTLYSGREHVNKVKDGKVYRGEHSLEENRQAMERMLNDRRCKPDRLLLDSLQQTVSDWVPRGSELQSQLRIN